MIRYLKHREIDKPKWDECIRNSPNGFIYAYSWYLDIVCPGWEALIEDDYVNIMPLPVGKKYGFTYTYPPPFTQQLGLFSGTEITLEKTKEFFTAIPPSYRYIEMNLNEHNFYSLPGFKTRKLITHLIDLKQDYTDIHSSYSNQTKRNLKKALSSSLIISQDVPPKKIIDLFKANRGKRYKRPVSYYTLLENLMGTIIAKGVGQSIGVFDADNALCAGAFLLESNNRCIFLFSGTNKVAFETHAMTFLINNYLEEKSGQFSVFDFEGSMDTDLARFYNGFGSKKVEFLQIRKNTLPPTVKWIKEIQFKRRVS